MSTLTARGATKGANDSITGAQLRALLKKHKPKVAGVSYEIARGEVDFPYHRENVGHRVLVGQQAGCSPVQLRVILESADKAVKSNLKYQVYADDQREGQSDVRFEFIEGRGKLTTVKDLSFGNLKDTSELPYASNLNLSEVQFTDAPPGAEKPSEDIATSFYQYSRVVLNGLVS